MERPCTTKKQKMELTWHTNLCSSMSETVCAAPSSPSTPSSWQLFAVVVGVAVAGSSLVLWYPLSIVQVWPAIWHISSGRVRLVLPQQLCLDVDNRVLLQTGGLREERRRRWEESLLILVQPQVLWVAASWQQRRNKSKNVDASEKIRCK